MLARAVRAIRDRYMRHRRAHDLEFLWPTLKRQAVDIEQAKEAFALHCTLDPAWRTVDPDKVAELIATLS